MTISEQNEFTRTLVEKLATNEQSTKVQAKERSSEQLPLLKRIEDLAHKLLSMEDVEPDHHLSEDDIKSISLSRDLVLKVRSFLEFFLRAQSSYLVSLCKFSYLSQRIFLYLFY